MPETLSILVSDTGCPLWSTSPVAMDTLLYSPCNTSQLSLMNRLEKN